MPTEDQILLKLVIKGMDPAEVQQLAASTQGELNARIKAYLDQLVVLHKQANDATTKSAKDTAQEQIKDLQDQVDAVNKVQRAHEIAANRAASEWRRTAEDLENITTVARGVIDVMTEGWERFKRFGEEIIVDTKIYEGLRGSINQMREATRGEVADIDLISAKNRGFAKELTLTDEQYGLVAAAAKHYADVTGTNVKEALDGLIDGLATGRTKMLQHVGVMGSATEAAAAFAQAHGLVTSELTDGQKVLAVQEAALKSIGEATEKWGEKSLTVASALERLIAGVKNLGTETKKSIGSIRLATFASVSPYGDTTAYAAAQSEFRKEEEAAAKQAAEDAMWEAERKRLAVGNSYGKGFSVVGHEPDKPKPFDLSQWNGGEDPYDNYSPYGKQSAGGQEREYQARGADMGEQGAAMDKAEKDFAGRNDKDFEEIVKKRAENLREIIDKGGGGVPGGLMAQLLFGPNGPNETYKHLDEFQKNALDTSSMIAGAGKKMADALGASIAASIAGDKAHSTSVRQATHDILEGLAAQAIGRALYETAAGIADLAMFMPGPAALHFESAALFGAIGVGAGLGARAVGTSGSSSAASGGSSAGSGGFTSGPRSSGSSSGSNADKPPITINISGVLPGTEAQIGREIVKALGAYTRESGSDITALTTGKAAA